MYIQPIIVPHEQLITRYLLAFNARVGAGGIEEEAHGSERFQLSIATNCFANSESEGARRGSFEQS